MTNRISSVLIRVVKIRVNNTGFSATSHLFTKPCVNWREGWACLVNVLLHGALCVVKKVLEILLMKVECVVIPKKQFIYFNCVLSADLQFQNCTARIFLCDLDCWLLCFEICFEFCVCELRLIYKIQGTPSVEWNCSNYHFVNNYIVLSS